MRLTSVCVSEHLRLKNVTAAFSPISPESPLADLYGRLNLSLVVGPNGAGKTSLLSFIAQVFHNLERFPERIAGPFSIAYELAVPDRGPTLCTLYKRGNEANVSLRAEGHFDEELTPDDPRKRSRSEIRDRGTPYSKLRAFLPTKIVISAFSLHGEYPAPRSKNYLGEHVLSFYDIRHIYGENHWGFPSLSKGIRRLMELVRDRAPGISEVERLLGGSFTGFVIAYDRDDGTGAYFDPRNPESNWVPFDQGLVDSEEEEHGEVYLNDFQIRKSGSRDVLCLSNMSSGQKMLFIRLLSLLSSLDDGALVIIEEPELHLDPGWTRQLITLFILLFRNYGAHFLIATHSFSLINACPVECVLIAEDGRFRPPSTPTLLANESALAMELFSPEPHLVEQHMMALVGRATKSELFRLMAKMGESAARVMAYQKWRSMKD